jgi:DNA-binding transcriptional regulator LsrR (DeoR family)
MKKVSGIKKNFMPRARRRPPSRPSDQELSLATRAAWLSFIGGYTQSDIAVRLGLSPAKAHRLIALAQQRGLVKVFVEGVPAECIALEDALIDRFALTSCTVAPSVAAEGETRGAFAAVGAAGARFLHRYLEGAGPALVGVGKGRTLTAAVVHMPAMRRPDLKFVSVSGSLTRTLATNPYDVVHKLVANTGGEGYFLPVPYFAASLQEKQVLLAQKSVQDLLGLARQAHLFVVGIGALNSDAHVRQTGMVSDAEWTALRRLGAVGDLMGSFLDRDGRPIDAAVNRQSVGLTIGDLRGRRVVALAGGAGKANAILAALRTGVISDLITDEAAARPIVDALEEIASDAGKDTANREPEPRRHDHAAAV